jgi:hypothetical protein
MSAAATAAGYLYAHGRLSGAGGNSTQSARITQRSRARAHEKCNAPVRFPYGVGS